MLDEFSHHLELTRDPRPVQELEIRLDDQVLVDAIVALELVDGLLQAIICRPDVAGEVQLAQLEVDKVGHDLEFHDRRVVAGDVTDVVVSKGVIFEGWLDISSELCIKSDFEVVSCAHGKEGLATRCFLQEFLESLSFVLVVLMGLISHQVLKSVDGVVKLVVAEGEDVLVRETSGPSDGRNLVLISKGQGTVVNKADDETDLARVLGSFFFFFFFFFFER